ncbi:anhydro-N-acetylmuramic acid kinase [Candidatus Zixiibacteriota bacterium]
MSNTRAARLLAGCMSGTSADGIDTALLRLEGDYPDISWELLASRTDPLPEDLRNEILLAAHPETSRLDRSARLHVRLGEAYAVAVESMVVDAGYRVSELAGTGLHGQTVFHDPRGVYGRLPEEDPDTAGVSIQIGSAAVAAERLGCDVISDFRSRDVAAGGEGAPLVPFADAIFFRDSGIDRIMLNIGGIANVTWLPTGRGIDGVTGFDTGPGIMVIDGLIRSGAPGMSFDIDGMIAEKGVVITDLLEELLTHPFLLRTPPKSTGREEFGAIFTDMAIWAGREVHPLADLVRTAVEFTVESIARAIETHVPQVHGDPGSREIIIAGGGARNPVLMESLAERLAPLPIRLSDELGLPIDAREAAAFALLADAFLMGVPANIPAVTGAERSVVLGNLVPGPRRPLHAGAGKGSEV